MKNRRKLIPRRNLTRRDFLRVIGTVGAGAVLAACGPAGAVPAGSPTETAAPLPTVAPTAEPTCPAPAEPVLRIAHISDVHVDTDKRSNELFSRALRNLQTHAPAFDFVLNTGDCVMDAMYQTLEDAQARYDVFERMMGSLTLPVYHTIGNHDVWGWGLSKEQIETMKGDPLFGKGLPVQRLGMPGRYYTFGQSGWQFIVLDSTHLADQSFFQPYTGKLDEEQFAWLDQTLNNIPADTPVCIVSHIPIFAVNGLLDGDNEKSGDWVLPGAWMHIDARRLWELFWKHPNVKICLSGHSHQIEDLKYHGVHYLNDGAISGNWWKGDYFDSPPGYMSLSLYADGSVTTEYVVY